MPPARIPIPVEERGIMAIRMTLRSDKVDRPIVCLTLLRRSVSVEIDRQWASRVTDETDQQS
jgi:hypothetical protein